MAFLQPLTDQNSPTPSPCCAFSGPERWLRGERSGGASLRYALSAPIRGGEVERVEQLYRNKYNIYNPLFYIVNSGVIGKRRFTPRWRCVSYMEIAPLAPPLPPNWGGKRVTEACSTATLPSQPPLWSAKGATGAGFGVRLGVWGRM